MGEEDLRPVQKKEKKNEARLLSTKLRYRRHRREEENPKGIFFFFFVKRGNHGNWQERKNKKNKRGLRLTLAYFRSLKALYRTLIRVGTEDLLQHFHCIIEEGVDICFCFVFDFVIVVAPFVT